MRIDIKARLAEKGMNKNQFAKEVKIGYPAACAIYEGQTTRISFDVLESICIALECTPNDIILSDEPQLKRLLAYHHKLSNLKDDTV